MYNNNSMTDFLLLIDVSACRFKVSEFIMSTLKPSLLAPSSNLIIFSLSYHSG